MADTVTPIRPSRRRDAEATYDAILQAARAILVESGPEALTVAEVAARARINRTTAYQHFRTRADLIAAVIEMVANELTLSLDSDVPIGQRLEATIEYFVEHPEIARLWMFQMMSDIPLKGRDGWHRYIDNLDALAGSDAAASGIDPEMLAHVLLFITLAWPLRVRTESASAADARRMTKRYTREIKRLLLHGVLNPDAWPDLVGELDTDEKKPRGRPKKGRK